MANIFGSTWSFNSILEKYEYNSSLYIPFGNTDFIENVDFLCPFWLLLFSSFEECRLLSSEENKNFGNPSFFFSLYIIIFEHIPIKFLNKTTSLISSLDFPLFSLSLSSGIGGSSILLKPTCISELITFFFLLLLNLIIMQFVSLSDNLYKGLSV